MEAAASVAAVRDVSLPVPSSQPSRKEWHVVSEHSVRNAGNETMKSKENSMWVIQYSCTNAYESMAIYAPVDITGTQSVIMQVGIHPSATDEFVHSQIIKIPVSWEALVKLVNWFYYEELPKPKSGCLWDNLNSEEKLHELQPYVELHWLGDFCLLGELCENCLRVIISFLESDRHLSIKIIQMATNLFQWKLAEVAANYMAPLYHRLRNCGELEPLDEELIDMVRAASARLFEEVGLYM
ncbi:hypothetical protein F0562_010047 [Nyssa sinensis]|uniref:HD-Zip IV C-terminal domain-containing protein n=1 Tax=Nyssa sinensis TaxID=561372 RepID=A0A5J5A0E1_9ASTE|nr:hypothetical protein F0562_010047 [Nyssa sinensis]